ncbi:MAG: hypothetical protein Q9222_004395 [Ikaeria aurantiellina]
MKFLSLTSLALATSFMPFALAAPAPNTDLVERQSPADAPAALAIVNQLYVDVKKYTATINSTAASLSKTSSPAQKAAAGKTFKSAIASINTLVVKTTSSIKALPGKASVKRDAESAETLAVRQVNPADPTGLATTLTLILLEIGGALNNIIAILGLITSPLVF